MKLKKVGLALLLIVSIGTMIRSETSSAQTGGLLPGETKQTNPKNRQTNLSVTVSDTESPSVPLLISPENGAVLSNPAPSFVWEESTDNFSMSYYILTVDGSILFNSIPLTDITNGSYVLTKSGTQYTLTPVSSLTDGTHTWKITAVDINGNTAESSTWSFTIGIATPETSATTTLTPGAQPISPTPTPTPLIEITPTEITNLVPQIPEAIQELAQNTGPIASALISGAIPLTATALLASQFGWGVFLQILLRILQAIGILPPPSPQGLVFNSDTEKPVPFAILNIAKLGESKISETVVTNTDGVYGGVQLPAGKYSIEVRHQDFVFPTVKSRPNYLTIFEFYKGEQFEVSSEKAKQLFLIPVDPVRQLEKSQLNLPIRLIRERIIRLFQYLLIPLFLLSLVITLFYPTVVNMAVCSIYIIIIVFRLVRWFKKPMIVGKVVDSSGNPLSNVFVRIFLQESNQLMSVLVTDGSGHFKAFLPKNEYQVSLSKQKYVWTENGEVQNFYLADARKSAVVLLAVMEDSQKLYKELFS